VELDAEDAVEVTKTYFDNYSFLGFVIPRESPIDLQSLVEIEMESRDAFDPARLPDVVTWFEDADHGSALKIHSKSWSFEEIKGRLHLGELDAMLADIPLGGSP
jgi:hypothetical protein